jgi:hypothetical protein
MCSEQPLDSGNCGFKLPAATYYQLRGVWTKLLHVQHYNQPQSDQHLFVI